MPLHPGLRSALPHLWHRSPFPLLMKSPVHCLSRLAALWFSAVLLAGAARAEKLVIGFEDINLYPYGKPSETQVYVGYLRTILDAFAADRGHELEFAVIPLKRLFLEFGSGDVDMFIPDNPAWSQEYKKGVDVSYSDAVAVVLDGFAVLPGREREPMNEQEIHIGVILGVTVEPLFEDRQRQRIVFDRASRFESVFRALLLGRVDAVHCNLAVAGHVLSTLGRTPDSVAWNASLPRFKSYFHVSSTRGELIAELNAWLRAHQDELSALKQEYGILEQESRPWGAE